jgi:hypothetical protein
MASFNKFNLFVEDCLKALHDFSSHTYKVILTNTAPVATNHVYSDISATELANGNGYLTGGAATTIGLSNSSGTETITGTDIVWTATAGLGPFRYAVLYNATNGGLVGWWDYGTSTSLLVSETFTFDSGAGVGNQLFTQS